MTIQKAVVKGDFLRVYLEARGGGDRGALVTPDTSCVFDTDGHQLSVSDHHYSVGRPLHYVGYVSFLLNDSQLHLPVTFSYYCDERYSYVDLLK